MIELMGHPNEQLETAIRLFNRGDYFEAAASFERVFSGADTELKDLAGALNRVAAAFHLRFNRGGRRSSINLLSQAMLILEDLEPTGSRVDIKKLREELEVFTEAIRQSPRDETQGVRHRMRLLLERRRAPKIHITQ